MQPTVQVVCLAAVVFTQKLGPQATLKRAKPGSSGSEDSRGGSPTGVPGDDALDFLDHLTPEEKAARTKNKNREAQKRFREKAKQRLDNLKIEAEQLEASLVRVTAEKQVLEMETRGLEQQVDNTIFSQSSLLPRLKLVGVLPGSIMYP